MAGNPASTEKPRFRGSPRPGAVPGMDEDIPGRHTDVLVLVVGVADADDLHEKEGSLAGSSVRKACRARPASSRLIGALFARDLRRNTQ